MIYTTIQLIHWIFNFGFCILFNFQKFYLVYFLIYNLYALLIVEKVSYEIPYLRHATGFEYWPHPTRLSKMNSKFSAFVKASQDKSSFPTCYLSRFDVPVVSTWSFFKFLWFLGSLKKIVWVSNPAFLFVCNRKVGSNNLTSHYL